MHSAKKRVFLSDLSGLRLLVASRPSASVDGASPASGTILC
jgi:hypothetical protein